MRKINKRAPLPAFQEFSTRHPGADWTRDFSSPGSEGYVIYKETRLVILLEEQECQCGYTEVLINNEVDCHIDHFRKRALFQGLTFNWNNLVAACNSEDFGAKYKDNKARISQSDYSTFFNPVDDPVQDFIYVNQRGEIEPNPSLTDSEVIDKVNKTIEVFNLQDKSLVSRRKTIIEQIRSYNDLSPDEIRRIMAVSGFKTVVMQETQV